MSQSANATDATRRLRRSNSSSSSSHGRSGILASRDTACFAKRNGKPAFPRATSGTSPADSAESSDENDQLLVAEARAILNCTDSTSANELPPSLQASPPTSNRDLDDVSASPVRSAALDLPAPLAIEEAIAQSDDLKAESDAPTPITPEIMASRAVTRRAKEPPAEQNGLKLPEPRKSSVLSSIVRPFTSMIAASAAVFFWHPLSVVTMIGPQRMRLLAQRRIAAGQGDDDDQAGPGSLYDGFRYAHRRAARMALNGEDEDSDDSDEFLNDDAIDFKEQRKRVKEVLDDVERRIASLERRRERLLERLERLDDDDTPPATAGVVASEPGLPRGLPLEQLQGNTVSSSEESRLPAKGRRRPRTSSETVPTCRHTLTGHDGIVTCIDLDFTTGRVVSGSSDRTVRVWDGNIGQCERVLTSHSGSIYCLQLEGERLITGSQDRTIRQWDLSKLHAKDEKAAHRRGRRAGKEEAAVQSETEPEDADADEMNASDAADHNVDEDGASEKRARRRRRRNKIIQDAVQADEPAGDPCLVNTLTGHTDAVTCLHFDANCLVSGSADRTLRQWDLSTGTCVLHMDAWWAAHGARPPPSGAYSSVNDSFVGALQFWQYALCSGTADGVIRMWDLRTGQTHRTLTGHA